MADTDWQWCRLPATYPSSTGGTQTFSVHGVVRHLLDHPTPLSVCLVDSPASKPPVALKGHSMMDYAPQTFVFSFASRDNICLADIKWINSWVSEKQETDEGSR